VFCLIFFSTYKTRVTGPVARAQCGAWGHEALDAPPRGGLSHARWPGAPGVGKMEARHLAQCGAKPPRQWQRTTWLQGAASDTSRVAREREVKLLLRRWGNGSKQRQALYRSWRQWREVTREAAVVEVQTASQALVAEEKARVSVEYEQKLLALDELCSKDTAALEAQLQEKAAAALALEKRVTELEAQLKVNATENNIFLKVTHAN